MSEMSIEPSKRMRLRLVRSVVHGLKSVMRISDFELGYSNFVVGGPVQPACDEIARTMTVT
jgi:hypothetical protein